MAHIKEHDTFPYEIDLPRKWRDYGFFEENKLTLLEKILMKNEGDDL